MSSHHLNADPLTEERARVPWGLAFGLFAAIAIFFLWEEHRVHILGLLPWALVLACPLIHVFMHRGHGSHSGHQPDPPRHSHGERS